MQHQCELPCVRVVWVDSCEPADNAEIEEHEIPDVQQIVQCGLLARQTEESISIAGAWKPETRCFDYVITIPRFAVKSMETLSTVGGASNLGGLNGDSRTE